MWVSALQTLRCPSCGGVLHLSATSPQPVTPQETEPRTKPESDDNNYWVEDGELRCSACKVLFPIHRGVPILLTYRTAVAASAVQSRSGDAECARADDGFQLPGGRAASGEELVGRSFSTEWEEYDYGPTLWIAATEDRLKTFRGECGLRAAALRGKKFCEIGCGLGIITNDAATTLGAEAWGIDLSSAIFRAAQQFKSNPRVHFVQASVFALPFASATVDFVYSHGVLHHTWSTEQAVRHATRLVKESGTMYVWLYGHADVRISFTRRIAFEVERALRPLLAKTPSMVTTAILIPMIPVYQLASYLGQQSGTHSAIYTAKQALHAARDRFTPLFAHRHEVDQVARWFRELGFSGIHQVSGGEVAPSWSLAIERNVAIRASRT